MKLVEILARELDEWPERVVCFTQDGNTHCYGWPTTSLFCDNGLWYTREAALSLSGYKLLTCLSKDHTTAIVTKDMWQAERNKLLSSTAKEDRWTPQVGDMVEYKNRDSIDYAWDKPEVCEVISVHEGKYGLKGSEGFGYVWTDISNISPRKDKTEYEVFEEKVLTTLLCWVSNTSKAKAIVKELYEKGMRIGG